MRTPPPDRRRARGAGDADPAPASAREELQLSPLGQAFVDALRDDERFRDIIADPFGDHGPAGD